MKKTIPVLLSFFMVLSSFSAFFITAGAAGYKEGDIINYGSYPQSQVTDSSLISALNSQGGQWDSYGYYTGTASGGYDYFNHQINYDNGQMKASDIMLYKDVEYDGNKYRGVLINDYRPSSTGLIPSADFSPQDDMGYIKGNTYWFKYEPLNWRIVEPETGYVICKDQIDCQAFNNFLLWSESYDLYDFKTDVWYGDAQKEYFACNYAKSSIRQWLNNDFYNTAFSEEQKANILTTTLRNTGPTDEFAPNEDLWSCEDTHDKVFLTSAINGYPGLSSTDSLPMWDQANMGCAEYSGGLLPTDYAICQGSYVKTTDWGIIVYDSWWLRTAYDTSRDVLYGVDTSHVYDRDPASSIKGIIPAMRLQVLKSDPAPQLSFLQRIIQWFKDLFASLFGL